ncbi:hypothetical protein [Runella zeae]|uniref:hypothetical protein n=1 Tax=Runella zeae TaxID=94255 RepID=UPI0023560412|nr:hypothetical protein [Runella zeae]
MSKDYKEELLGDAGKYLSSAEIKSFREAHREKHIPLAGEKKDTKGIRKGEYFSAKVFEEMAKLTGCVGFVLYYGVASEAEYKIDTNKGTEIMPRLFIVPVDEKGNEIPFKVDSTGLKDGEEFGGAGEGKPIPPFGQ